jgi:cell division control protein 6
MAAVIEAVRKARGSRIGTGEAYDAYRAFCDRVNMRRLSGRAFGDLLAELDMCSLIRSSVLSRGRYGRTREIILDLPDEVVEKMYGVLLLGREERR